MMSFVSFKNHTCIFELMTGALKVILEFCKFGNLRSYILRHQNNFVDQVTSGLETIELDNLNSTGESSTSSNVPAYKGDYHDKDATPITTSDLTSWGFQIANGMKYLSQKRV